jgi:hypothetical protein
VELLHGARNIEEPERQHNFNKHACGFLANLPQTA